MFEKYPKSLIHLISYLKKLPGVGNKTAERFAFQLLKWKKEQLTELSHILSTIKEDIRHCPECGALMGLPPCPFCQSTHRKSDFLCIVSSPKDVFSMEETKSYQGLYHVIDNLLSPLDGYGHEHLHIDRLKERIKKHQVKEIIIALDSTLEGDATALFLKDELSSLGLPVSRLAFGLPVGSSLEYIDESTLTRAFLGRQIFH
ncbi:MAG: recombination mediator RecR [Chlamydiota bacterium]